jgi:PAT family beta-lactamase induction signal transducer AmpG
MFGGRILNTVGARVGWATSFAVVAALFVPLAVVTVKAPEPEVSPAPPRTMREAVWDPFVGFFRHHRALEIAAFLFFYKFADNLASALVSPFLGLKGYSPEAIGIGQGTVGIVGNVVGTFLGGILATPLGLGRALWVFGLLQAVSNLGYVAIASSEPNALLMYVAMGIEAATSGMGTGAFGILLLRLTQRRFSATQYALFSSIFALGRTFAGPPAGALVDAIGWRDFFLFTIPAAIPGLLMLQRFVPWWARELPAGLEGEEEPPRRGEPISRGGVVARGLFGALVGTAVAYVASAMLVALKAMRGSAAGFDVVAAFVRMAHPVRPVDWVDVVGPPVVGLVIGLAVAAYVVARRGLAPARAG